MNLFKRFCAVITVIAIIASFGVTAFATEGTPAVEITNVATALKSAGVYTVTITYNATGVGDMGVTMLSYLSASGSLEEGNTFDQGPDPAAPAMYVAGIDQWAVENGTGRTKSFDVKVGTPGTGSVAYGATNLVMMGGDGVTGADIATYAIQWDATGIAAAGTLALTDVPYGSDEAAIAALVKAKLGTDITLTYTGADSKTAAFVDYDDVTVVVAKNDDAYTVEFTTATVNAAGNVAKLPESVTTLTTGAQALSVAFAPFAADAAEMKGETQAITVGLAEVEGAVTPGSEPTLVASGLDALVATKVAEKVTAKGIVLKSKTNNEWTQEVTAEQLVDGYALTAAYKEGTLQNATNFTAEDATVVYTITVPAMTVGNAALEAPVTFDVTVTVTKYVAEWNVTAASYKGAAIDSVYDMPKADLTDGDKETMAEAAVIGAEITLTGDYETTVAVDAAWTREFATDKVTVTIPAGKYNNAVVAEPGLTVDIPVTFTENTADFTFASVVFKKGAEETAATALNVTVDESKAEKIATAIAADYKAYVTLTRGTWTDTEATELALGAAWITATAPSIEAPATTGAYTATIAVPANAIDGAAADTLEISGTVTVKSYTVGDVNEDDIVDDTDIIFLTRYYFEWPGYGPGQTYNVNLDAADVYKDGIIDDTDIIYLTRYYFEWPGYVIPTIPAD